MKAKGKLNAKQARFVQEYLKDLNATQAAVRAGYSAKTADTIAGQLLRKTWVAEAVASGTQAKIEESKADQQYVLDVITETIDRCRQVRPVLDRKGDPVMAVTPAGEVVPAFTFDPQAVLKGAELLGRHLAMFNDKIKVIDDRERMSDDELREQVAEMYRKHGINGPVPGLAH